ncbi:hypothetical protein GQ44DRAFT_269833 [Phaeosphaeriaceae sp. PMI808]|nr:hypothetical protein GQ44DRAFT_269833 [Phaeosphaeriaceae sp. PMI808]
MELLRLDMLPMEVLQAISDILHLSCAPSVARFSFVIRQCRRAASPALFRSLRIHATSPGRLADDVERWTSTLLANDSFRYIRQIVIWGDIYHDWNRQAHQQVPDANGKQSAPFDYEKSWLLLAHFLDRTRGLKDLLFECGTLFPSCLLAVLPKPNLSPCRLHISDFILDSLEQDLSNGFTEPLELNS